MKKKNIGRQTKSNDKVADNDETTTGAEETITIPKEYTH